VRQPIPLQEPRDDADPDGTAIRAALAGDAAAFGSLVERHHAALLRILVGVVGDPHAAEDVAQEIWIIVYRRLPGFQFRARFSTWLYRVAIREACSAKRRIQRWLGRHVALGGRDAPAPGREVGDELASHEEIHRALARLPRSERIAFVLYAEGLRYEEIAAAQDCGSGTVATRIHRARRRLAEFVPLPAGLDSAVRRAKAAPVTRSSGVNP
jgi:RNA polymerase sigma-70 factor (ECF subfamily)